MSNFAWVTLTTNDTYSLGALVLANSLKRVSTKHQLAILVTPGVSDAMKMKLKDVYNVVQEVDVMDSKDSANLALLARPELGITFTKLHCWRLVQFEKCVFLDADTLVLQNCDELFDRDEFSAAPDVSWPDCFNSGVFVYCPNLDTYTKIIQFALENGSFDGGDQGVLNQYFSDWSHQDIKKHLPFIYNTAAFATYCYLPAFKQFRDRIKILHFAGRLKPWLATFNPQNKTASTPQGYEHAADLIQLWWNIFCDNVHDKLSNQMAGLAGALANIKLGQPRTIEQEQYEEHMRRESWESGNIDYTGKDSFDNIWKKISQTMEAKPSSPAASAITTVAEVIAPPPVPSSTITTESKDKSGTRLFSADIQDGKVEIDRKTNVKTEYKHIPGGYTVTITTPEPNGCYSQQTKTFYDPVPVTEEELNKMNKNKNKKTTDTNLQQIVSKDPNTTVQVRKIPNGREEIYTTVRPDGTKSIQIKTFYDAEEEQIIDNTTEVNNTPAVAPKKKTTTNKAKKDDQQQLVEKQTKMKKQTSQESTHEYKSEKTVEETRRVTETTKVSGKSTKTRTDSIDEQQELKSLTTTTTDKKDIKKKKPKALSGPPVPPEFIDKPGEKTTVVSRKIKGGTEFIYTTLLTTGQTVTSTKTVYEEEECEMTEEEIRAYQKQLREAEKHKDIKKAVSLKSTDGTKKILPSDKPGEVTTVETIRIDGGTEYHYTTVTADGLVKKSSKTVYDPVPCQKVNEDDTDEEEIIEEYEEEIIEPGEKITRTIESVCNLSSHEEHREVIEKKKLGQSVTVSEGITIKKREGKKSKKIEY